MMDYQNWGESFLRRPLVVKNEEEQFIVREPKK